jgi:hypothetical protein
MPTNSPSGTSARNSEPAQRPAWQRIGVIVGAGVLVVLFALLVGWLLGRAPVGDLQSRVQTVEQQRDQAAARAEAGEALALLYRSVLDLDVRNFGTANDRLNRSAALLGAVDARALGVSPEALAELQQALAEKDIRVAEDLDQQRAQVLGYAQELAELTGATSLP